MCVRLQRTPVMSRWVWVASRDFGCVWCLPRFACRFWAVQAIHQSVHHLDHHFETEVFDSPSRLLSTRDERKKGKEGKGRGGKESTSPKATNKHARARHGSGVPIQSCRRVRGGVDVPKESLCCCTSAEQTPAWRRRSVDRNQTRPKM